VLPLEDPKQLCNKKTQPAKLYPFNIGPRERRTWRDPFVAKNGGGKCVSPSGNLNKTASCVQKRRQLPRKGGKNSTSALKNTREIRANGGNKNTKKE